MKRSFVNEAIHRLVEHYDVRHPEKRPPFESLVRTILSQHTTEAVSIPVADELLGRYPTPAAIAKAAEGELEAMLEPIGLFRQKATRLRELGRLIDERYGGDAGCLLELAPGEMRRELLTINGIGEKTADCFMLFAAGLDVLPVDTHVDRIARLWGLVGNGAGYGGVRASLEGVIQPEMYGRAHIALIRHGRVTCRARKPKCGECVVSELCPAGEIY